MDDAGGVHVLEPAHELVEEEEDMRMSEALAAADHAVQVRVLCLF